MSKAENLDPREAERFDELASRWWDPEGECRPLHDINGPRADYIATRARLDGARALDVGCGGGLLSEALAERGARVTGIDVARRALSVAEMHRHQSGLEIEYRNITAESLALEINDGEIEEGPERFDVVCCLEMLEHVPRPWQVVEACAALTRPGGQVFFSTINRSALAWMAAIAGAEYLLRLLPRGTHRYDRLIKPSELAAWCRTAGLTVHDITGMDYNPFSRTVRIGSPPRVNYLLHAERPE